MNINRINYEEYFLLYADKELSAADKNMVEIFVEQNPDLEEEFIMLKQSVLKPDTLIKLNDKSLLFKKEEFITIDNYEEKFLLYADNELNLSEIEETEKFVLDNPVLQSEFTFLQQVNYKPDATIGFPDKSSLYKKEVEIKVIHFRWKALAAAVIAGLGIWTGITYQQNNKVKPAITAKQIFVPKEKNAVTPITPNHSLQTRDVVIDQNKNSQTIKVIQGVPGNQVNKQITFQQKNIVNTKSVITTPEVKGVEKQNEDVAMIDLPVKKTNDLPEPINAEPNPIDKSVTATPSLPNNNYAQPASYIAEAEIKSENYVFYNITAEEFKKSKVGNFLKKIKRVVERQIPFKNNKFKIGTAEIAKDEQN